MAICSKILAIVALLQAVNADSNNRSKSLREVQRFGYQLQRVDSRVIADSSADLAVVEPQAEGRRLSKDDVALMKRRTSGNPRIVLAYLSIGEAEEYRPYWKKEWKQKPPVWLGDENPEWKGNYKVRYWEKEWRSLILGSPDASLDRILADGYDGVYLDIVDGFEYWEQKGVKDARGQMVNWVAEIANYARKGRPGFLVVPQNGEALAKEPGYLAQVDAIGKEDLFFNGDRIQKRTAVAESQGHLKAFQEAGKPVFVIEYCRRDELRRDAVGLIRKGGYVPLVTVRKLDRWFVTPVSSRTGTSDSKK